MVWHCSSHNGTPKGWFGQMLPPAPFDIAQPGTDSIAFLIIVQRPGWRILAEESTPKRWCLQ